MIRVTGVKKKFAYNEVLKGVSFELTEGTIYGLIGRNGAGKTTLMKIMSGLMQADGGSIAYGEGKSLKVGYLPDLPSFYEYLTTDEYLDFLQADSPMELLKLVGLPPKARVKTMSRGMRQRLGIAGVLVGNPDVILLDEPTSALDPAGRNDVKNILLKLREQGKTIILSTHILADMDSICDRAGFLNNGVIVREVEMADSRKSASELVISFMTQPDIDKIREFAHEITVIDPVTIKINLDENKRLESQQQVLQGLAGLSQEIKTISSASLSLDKIFQEVCV